VGKARGRYVREGREPVSQAIDEARAFIAVGLDALASKGQKLPFDRDEYLEEIAAWCKHSAALAELRAMLPAKTAPAVVGAWFKIAAVVRVEQIATGLRHNVGDVEKRLGVRDGRDGLKERISELRADVAGARPGSRKRPEWAAELRCERDLLEALDFWSKHAASRGRPQGALRLIADVVEHFAPVIPERARRRLAVALCIEILERREATEADFKRDCPRVRRNLGRARRHQAAREH
jgi:hypothetical protein